MHRLCELMEETNQHPSTNGACGARSGTLCDLVVRAPLAHSCLGLILGRCSRSIHSERRACVRFRTLYRFLCSSCQVPAKMANMACVLPTTRPAVSAWQYGTSRPQHADENMYRCYSRRCMCRSDAKAKIWMSTFQPRRFPHLSYQQQASSSKYVKNHGRWAFDGGKRTAMQLGTERSAARRDLQLLR